jgi:hypothetical protein
MPPLGLGLEEEFRFYPGFPPSTTNAPDGLELREDGTAELREDGGYELRE